MNSLLDSFNSHVIKNPQTAAFFDYDKSQSYSWSDVNVISNGIVELIESVPRTEGGHSENYVLICTQQNILFPTSLLAAWKTHSIPVMVDENYTFHELLQIEQNLNPNNIILLLDEQFDLKVTERFKNKFKNVVVLDVKNIKTSNDNGNTVINDQNFALGLFTSGTSGTPKLCLFTHQNLFQAAQIETQNDPFLKHGYIANLRPHYTSAGLNSLWPSLLLGIKNLFSEKVRKIPMARILNELLEREALSLLILSPTYILSLFCSPDSAPQSKNKLPLYFGGSSLPWNILQALLENQFLPCMRYGMTEVAHILSIFSYSLNQDHYEKADVGIPFKNFELICLDGYVHVNSPGNASLVIDQGIKHPISKNTGYRTADRAEFNLNGSLQLLGRDNNTISINGFRFNSQQVEEVLMQSKLILDCRVFGFKYNNEEQQLMAFILIKNQNEDIVLIESTLKKLTKEKLSLFKHPKKFFFLTAWPTKANGKIDINKLKALTIAAQN